jgi:class 3 adenylate cyclase
VSMFAHRGKRTRRLVSFLRQRAKADAARRPEMDCRNFPELFRKRAVVFTDTADFTIRTARDGILHFLMVFERFTDEAGKVVSRSGGDMVKVEADSLLLGYDDVATACAGVEALESLLRRMNRDLPANERLRFSYGIGYGDVLDLDEDLFGLEVNLASKIGEDLARPGEALLTPSAAAALDAATLRRVVAHKVVTFGKSAIPISRLKLRPGPEARSRAR